MASRQNPYNNIRLFTFLLGALLALQFTTSCYSQWATFGVFDPDRGFDQDKLRAMDDWEKKQSSVQMVFTTFDPQEMGWLWNGLVNIYNSKKVPIISWEPWFLQAQGTPSNIEVLVANGNYDTYMRDWAAQLKAFIAGYDGQLNTADDRRAYIRFAHEFNGNWYPWSAKTGESSPADYVRMWKRVKDLVMSTGLSKSHIQWIWSGICFDVGDFKIEQYYPGNDYVDWIGLGGMNWGTSEGWSTWNSPVDLFAQMIPRIRAVSGNAKPVGITEWCSVSVGQGVGGKNYWLTSFFDFAISNKIRLLNYFNMDKKEGDNGGLKDWAIFAGANGDENYNFNGRWFKGYSAYRKAIANPYFIGSDSANTKLIEDAYFFGTGKCSQSTDCLSGYSCSNSYCVSGTATNTNTNTNTINTNTVTVASLVVFNDGTLTTPITWGSTGLGSSLNQGDPSAPEGSKSTQIWTTGWGGFGIFYGGVAANVAGYTNLQFYIKSSATVKIEIQDTTGKNYPIYQPSTNGNWLKVRIPLTGFVGVDKTKINGAFLATMEVQGYFAVDYVQYV